jgi:hypothetical protein
MLLRDRRIIRYSTSIVTGDIHKNRKARKLGVASCATVQSALVAKIKARESHDGTLIMARGIKYL